MGCNIDYMGRRYTFKCNKCGYNVESTGNLSCGMEAALCPYICNDCNIITDTMVGMYGVLYPYNLISGMPLNPKGDEVPEFLHFEGEDKDDYYTCKECNGKNLTVWNPYWRKCPKCGHRMIKGDGIFLIE